MTEKKEGSREAASLFVFGDVICMIFTRNENTMLLENTAVYGGHQGGMNMGTVTRPELSEKNRWWISKHRYYELKHFCLQYEDWKKSLQELDGYSAVSAVAMERIDTGRTGDPTANVAQILEMYSHRMHLVESAAFEACDHQFWWEFLLRAVTENVSYDALEARFGIMPDSRNDWYERYRRFFWTLDKMRE